MNISLLLRPRRTSTGYKSQTTEKSPLETYRSLANRLPGVGVLSQPSQDVLFFCDVLSRAYYSPYQRLHSPSSIYSRQSRSNVREHSLQYASASIAIILNTTSRRVKECWSKLMRWNSACMDAVDCMVSNSSTRQATLWWKAARDF